MLFICAVFQDTSAYGRRRDMHIRELAKKNNVEFVTIHGHHLYDPEEVAKRKSGKPTMSIGALQKACSGFACPNHRYQVMLMWLLTHRLVFSL